MTTSNAVKAMFFCGCAAGAFGFAAAASAQEAAAPVQQVQEIVVTAQRRSEVLEKVPMSVAVVTPATLAKSGVSSIHDINQLVAGASVNFAGCCSAPAIRGVSTLTTGVGFENNVAIYVDGFYVPDNVSVNGDLANISDIQVLKGPQGALWGRNATGGAILINTLDPTKTLKGDFEFGYGDYNEVDTKAYLAGPITDRIGFSIAEASRTSDGYNKWIGPTSSEYSNSLTPILQVTVRAKLKMEVTDWLTATAAFNYADSSDARGEVFQFYQNDPVFCILQCFASSTLHQAKGSYEASPDTQPTAQALMKEGTLKLVANTPIGDLSSYTSFAHRDTSLNFDFDNSWDEIYSSFSNYGQDTLQQSVVYNIDAIKNLDLVVGGDYIHDDQTGRSLGTSAIDTNAPPNFTTFANFDLLVPAGAPLAPFTFSDTFFSKHSESYALYFDGNYHLTSKLSIDVGGRYSHDAITMSRGDHDAGEYQFGSVDYSAFTPRVSVRYEVLPRSEAYFTYSQGYRTGGFDPSFIAPTGSTPANLALPFAPEKISSYEIGFKTVRGPVQFDSAIFYYDYSNMQVGLTIPAANGQVENVVSNAKKAETYGWDNSLSWRPIENGTIRTGIEYLHARYTDFNTTGNGLGLCTTPGTTPQCTVATQGQDVQEQENLDGKRMIRAPDFSGFVSGDYDFQNVFGGDLDAALNLTFTTAAPTENASTFGPSDPAQANEQRYQQGAYTLLNGNLTWKDASKHYTVTAWARNLGNTKFLIVDSGASGFGDFRSYGEPMTGGVRVGYSF